MKRWEFADIDRAAAARLVSEAGVDSFLALLLCARGVTEPQDALEMLQGTQPPSDPFLFADMDRAVECVQRALDGREKIAVYGDYDVDGITATVLLYTYLRGRGADVSYRIPLREEGYGLHEEALRRFAEEGVRLLITVDNGITAVEEVALARSLGMEVVVTDHHRPQQTLPEASAVVDPYREDCESTFKPLAGVGVAYKLVCALEGDEDAVLGEYADLVALGTLADVMPLTGENRALVRAGLEKIRQSPGEWLRALSQAASFTAAHTANSLVYTLTPRLNAAGRMGDPGCAAKLLLETDPAVCGELAAQVCSYNAQRQATENEILREVFAFVDAHPEVMARRVLVIEGENWHRGVVGILAARVVDRYGKPCLLLSVSDGIAKGSGRSVEGFPLFDAIASCRDLLLSFGGHSMAAGVTLPASRIAAFRDRLDDYAAREYGKMPVPPLRMDFRLSPSQVDVGKLQSISRLEPTGAGNPAPLFGLFSMKVEKVVPAGERHTRLLLSRDGTTLWAIRFGTPPAVMGLAPGDVAHFAVSLEKSEYRGETTVSVIVRDWRHADTDQERELAAFALYDRAVAGEALSEEERGAMCPEHGDAAALYRLLRRQGGYEGTAEHLIHLMKGQLPCEKVMPTLAVLREAGVVTVRDRGDTLLIGLRTVREKADLTKTPLWRRLAGQAQA